MSHYVCIMKLSLTLLISLVSSFPAFPAFEGSAQATSHSPFISCAGNGCNHLDPYATGCASADDPVASAQYGGVTVVLMYSTVCGTNWTQVYANTGKSGELSGCISRKAGPDGGATTDCYESTSYSWINTNQLYSPHNLAEACGNNGHPFGVCTGWW